MERLLEVDPDVIFVQTLRQPTPLSQQLAANPVWGQLKAVRGGQVYEVDYDIWSLGQGPRALGLVLDEAMVKLYPDVFPRPLP